jgi:hypothetical protein
MQLESKFFSWNDPFLVRRIRLGSNPWSPYLDKILQRIAANISENPHFHPELVDLEANVPAQDSTFISFFKDKDSLESQSSAFTVVGNIGVGKSSFLDWWLASRHVRSAEIDINSDGTRFKSSDLKITEHLPRAFSNELNLNRVRDAELSRHLSERVHDIQVAANGENFPDFQRQFLNQSSSFHEQFPDFDHRYVLLCQIAAVNKRYNMPVWLILDNVDMEEENTQDDYVRGAFGTYDWLVRAEKRVHWELRVHLVVTARPGTYRRWQHHRSCYQDITYPRPHLHPILQSRLRDALQTILPDARPSAKLRDGPTETQLATAALELGLEAPTSPVAAVGDLGFAIEFGGITLKTQAELREHLVQAFSRPLRPDSWPWRALYGPDEFHGHLVGDNVRRFINAWVHMICSDNFVKPYAFPDMSRERPYPSAFHYLRMLIRGPFHNFPGNHLIDGSGHSNGSPLVFNLYGLPYDNMGDAKYCLNYLVYVRVLEYLLLRDKEVRFSELVAELGTFFDKDILTDALRLLLWVRLIDEKKYGFVFKYKWREFRDVEIEQDAELSAGETARLYLGVLLCEYEYVSSMAAVSMQLRSAQHERPLPGAATAVQMAHMTTAFFDSLLRIIVSNLDSYRNAGALATFRRIFFADRLRFRPWRSGIEAAIKSLSAMAAEVPVSEYVEILKRSKVDGTSLIEERLNA